MARLAEAGVFTYTCGTFRWCAGAGSLSVHRILTGDTCIPSVPAIYPCPTTTENTESIRQLEQQIEIHIVISLRLSTEIYYGLDVFWTLLINFYMKVGRKHPYGIMLK